MKRLRCLIFGHDWRIVREAGCASMLIHIHVLMACDADCARCGKRWRDYESHASHGVSP